MAIGPWQLLIVLLIVVLLFGTKKLRGLGTDLGGAFKGFKNAMSDHEKAASEMSGNKDQLGSDAPASFDGENIQSKPQQKEKTH